LDFAAFMQIQETVLLDGAMGTELDKRGLMGRASNNLTAPEAVLAIHREYAACGCLALTTNTLSMNRVYLETHNMDVDVLEVNLAAAELAGQAAGEGVYVLGDISPTGQFLEPYGTYQESQFRETFAEQAAILAQGGVDGFIIETMFDLREAVCALRACKDVAPLPVIVSIAFSTEADGGRIIMGNTAAECAAQLTEAGADAVGANCGDLDPMQMAAVVGLMKAATDLPVLAQPNAGRPRLVGGETVFDMEPEAFAAGIRECIRAGARLVGGCCGTTPAHMRVLADVLRS